MTFTVLGFIAQVILAAVFLAGVAAIAWFIRAAVRGWKRASQIIAEAREIGKRPEIGDDTIAQFGPDAEFDREIRQWLAEGGKRD